VIVANGPSLNRFPLDFLAKETTICLNKIFLGLKKFRFYPRYYVAVNHKVIEQSVSQIRLLNCVKFIDSVAMERGLLRENALTHAIRENRSAAFSTDLSAGYNQGHTVTHAALQVAYHLGFSTVILIGLDHRYTYQGKPDEERILEGPDTNHFSPEYFGGGQRWDNPNLVESEKHYRAARTAYEADGRRIIDVTPDGACPVFEKSDYRTIFEL
jgi:hypothetical protein